MCITTEHNSNKNKKKPYKNFVSKKRFYNIIELEFKKKTYYCHKIRYNIHSGWRGAYTNNSKLYLLHGIFLYYIIFFFTFPQLSLKALKV